MALPDELLFPGLNVSATRRREDARRRALSLTLVALAYAGLAAAIAFERERTAPAVIEIPVEIVVPPPEPAPEPTPEPAPVKPEPPPPPPKAEDKPAYDAPKAGTAAEDDPDRKQEDKAPPALETPAKTAEASTSAETPEATPEPKPEPAPPLKPADDGEVALATPGPPAVAKPLFAVGRGKLFASLPSVGFGGAAKKAPVAGGEGPADYLNVVAGLVRARLHTPHLSRPPDGAAFGLIVFRLDSSGRIVESYFVQHSGSPEWDRAEMDALNAAAPFPKPPDTGRAIKYRYDID